jgi:hypothetical protein
MTLQHGGVPTTHCGNDTDSDTDDDDDDDDDVDVSGVID